MLVLWDELQVCELGYKSEGLVVNLMWKVTVVVGEVSDLADLVTSCVGWVIY